VGYDPTDSLAFKTTPRNEGRERLQAVQVVKLHLNTFCFCVCSAYLVVMGHSFPSHLESGKHSVVYHSSRKPEKNLAPVISILHLKGPSLLLMQAKKKKKKGVKITHHTMAHSSLRLLFSFFFVYSLCYFLNVNGLGCIDQKGNSVGWWVMLKFPIISGSSDPLAKAGYAYLYADVNNPILTYPEMSLNDTSGALSRTMTQIYSASSSTSWYFYDDEHPDGSEYDSFGHTKGCMGLNSQSGFWLIHSVPRFPAIPESGVSFSYPEEEAKYGQSFLCLSLSTSEINTVASLQLIDKPSIFTSQLTSATSSAAPNVVSLIGGKSFVTSPTSTNETITTTDGTSFVVFAKNSEWDNELYEYAVAPYLNSDLYVESWMVCLFSFFLFSSSSIHSPSFLFPHQDGVGPLPSYCKPKYNYNVQDIRQLAFSSIAYTETEDHSKWAITSDGDNYVCIGDINRQNGQLSRGGGTACQLNSKLWSSFSQLITNVDSC
jgi:deoxyribonuclease-2